MNNINNLINTSISSSWTSAAIGSATLFVAILTANYVRKSFQAPDTSHTGAGVLPYCIKNNQVYFLLSKEGYGWDWNTWCDFGGKKDPGENVIQTAARETWEESRGMLGDLKTIEKKISSAPYIRSKGGYQMFFMKVEDPSKITNEDFTKRTFKAHCRMEKTKIAWVKADDIFWAITHDRNRISITWSIFCWRDQLRGYFANNILRALNTPQERKALKNVCPLPIPSLKQAS